MEIVLCLVALVAIIFLSYAIDDELGFITSTIVGTVMIIILMTLPLNRMATRTMLNEIQSAKETIATARENGDLLENAAMQIKVIELNGRLADAQYWNNTFMDTFIIDDVAEIEPIR